MGFDIYVVFNCLVCLDLAGKNQEWKPPQKNCICICIITSTNMSFCANPSFIHEVLAVSSRADFQALFTRLLLCSCWLWSGEAGKGLLTLCWRLMEGRPAGHVGFHARRESLSLGSRYLLLLVLPFALCYSAHPLQQSEVQTNTHKKARTKMFVLCFAISSDIMGRIGFKYGQNTCFDLESVLKRSFVSIFHIIADHCLFFLLYQPLQAFVFAAICCFGLGTSWGP